jgi:DNA-damage-inducible protein J
LKAKCFTFAFSGAKMRVLRKECYMVQIGLRVEEEIKKGAEQACADMGLSLSAAINVFLTKVAKERRIPFELTADPFYSESNIRHLESIMRDIKDGKAHFAEHDLVEVE